MENTLIQSTETELTKQTAENLDMQIKAYANMAWVNLVESCKCLKRMRDTKLYEQLGYSTFGEYTEQSLGFKERQAYNYISILEKQGEAFLQLNANLGITKLSLLNAVPVTERDELVANNDLAGMTVEEVKKLVEENDHKGEQLGMLTKERDAYKNDFEDAETELEAAQDKIAELKKQLEAERNRPTEVAVAEPDEETLNKIRTEAADTARKEAEKTAKAEKKELKEKLTAEKDKAIADATSEQKKTIEALEAKIKESSSAQREALVRAEKLEKQLAVSSSPETTKFSFYFEALDTDYQKILDSISTLKKEAPEMAEKYAKAMSRYQGVIAERFSAIGFPLEG